MILLPMILRPSVVAALVRVRPTATPATPSLRSNRTAHKPHEKIPLHSGCRSELLRAFPRNCGFQDAWKARRGQGWNQASSLGRRLQENVTPSAMRSASNQPA